LAAKLQQDAERNLTRAFLYHATQENRGLGSEEQAKLEDKLKRFKEINDPAFFDYVRELEEKLHGDSKPIPWNDLIERFAQQNELREFTTEVWRERATSGRDMADDPLKLATMLLYRELLRRPRVQNNVEMMGLARLAFPRLEEKAGAKLPRALAESGVNAQDWTVLALAAIDFVFRDRLATWIPADWMMRFASPRSGLQRYSVCCPGLSVSDRPKNSRPWPVLFRNPDVHHDCIALFII